MWKDYLYFSKGERRALLILVSLLSISLGLLLFTDDPQIEIKEPIYSEQRTSYKTSNNLDKSDKSDPKEAVDYKKPAQQIRQPKQYKSAVDDEPRKYKNKQIKYPLGTVVDLNKADTSDLKCIPGIGSTYAVRIVKFRNILGGFHSVEQLKEVYGIDEKKFDALKEWFTVKENTLKKLLVNELPEDSIRKHPYIDYRQAKVLVRLRKKVGKLSGWDNLLLLEEFTEADKFRLSPYLSFD